MRDVLTANFEHCLGVSTARLLQAPGRRVGEVKTAGTWAVVTLLEVVANIEARVSFGLPEQSISTVPIVLDRSGHLEVITGVIAN